jgi:5-methylcytosine-specific restriction enzyme A
MEACALAKSAQQRQANREHNARRRRDQPWQAWYGLKRWKLLRNEQLSRLPLCQRCLSHGRATAATVAHHIVPHKGDPELFWHGRLASSCTDCHDIDEQRIERGGRPRQVLAADGWPID